MLKFSSSDPAAMRRVTGAQPDVRHASVAAIQIAAIVTMMVDHLGALSILGDWSRLVGRFALPAFVVMVAYNASMTTKPGSMAWRCLLLFALSQPFWWLSVGTWYRLNIMVTLLVVVLLVWAWRLRWPLLALVVITLFALVAPWVEYGAWPLLLVPLGIFGPLGALPALFWPLVQYGQWLYALPALVSVVVLVALVYVDIQLPRFPRWLTRWFYPGHLFVLSVIKLV